MELLVIVMAVGSGSTLISALGIYVWAWLRNSDSSSVIPVHK